MTNEPGGHSPKRNYKWPWFALAAVLLFLALAVLWMCFAVRREKQERDFNEPIPAGAR
jgi:bacteriorhodopsin